MRYAKLFACHLERKKNERNIKEFQNKVCVVTCKAQTVAAAARVRQSE